MLSTARGYHTEIVVWMIKFHGGARSLSSECMFSATIHPFPFPSEAFLFNSLLLQKTRLPIPANIHSMSTISRNRSVLSSLWATTPCRAGGAGPSRPPGRCFASSLEEPAGVAKRACRAVCACSPPNPAQRAWRCFLAVWRRSHSFAA